MSSLEANQGVPPAVTTGGHNQNTGTIVHGLDGADASAEHRRKELSTQLQREKGLTDETITVNLTVPACTVEQQTDENNNDVTTELDSNIEPAARI
ncbi:hypothetical protein LIER_32634 [Lithospermum erythrorhizon]|uniref:Uncharacterized protein n=1 Tax=Lithospermum erythrorhizon TaxID=34254 RepID=A0AAV3RUD6_LITER